MRRLLALLLLCSAAPAALSAESYDACAGFIDALPATISTQGTWCLRKDLSTTQVSGAAITITTNNVNVDCNGFKVGGLGGGSSSQAAGLFAANRRNLTVRHCALRGFRYGVYFSGSETGGHLIEDNRIDQSLANGIVMHGDGNLIQRNLISDTGDFSDNSVAIHASADIVDNTIDGVVGLISDGIQSLGVGSQVRGNRVRNLLGGEATAIVLDNKQSAIDNQILGRAQSSRAGTGIFAPVTSVCRGNLIANFSDGVSGCTDAGGNVTH